MPDVRVRIGRFGRRSLAAIALASLVLTPAASSASPGAPTLHPNANALLKAAWRGDGHPGGDGHSGGDDSGGDGHSGGGGSYPGDGGGYRGYGYPEGGDPYNAPAPHAKATPAASVTQTTATQTSPGNSGDNPGDAFNGGRSGSGQGHGNPQGGSPGQGTGSSGQGQHTTTTTATTTTTPATATPAAVNVPAPAAPAAATPTTPAPTPAAPASPPPTAPSTAHPKPAGAPHSGASQHRRAGSIPITAFSQHPSHDSSRSSRPTGRGPRTRTSRSGPRLNGRAIARRGAVSPTVTSAVRGAAPRRPVGRLTGSRGETAPIRAAVGAHQLIYVPALIGNLVPLPVPDWSKPIILALLLVCLVLAFRAAASARRAHRLERQRTEMTADLESMQAALVPQIPSRLGALAVSVAYRPADGPAAGGDFYDAFALDGNRVAVIVGDVSGHGRHALARAAHMHYTLRAYVETGLDPRSALKLAGRVLGTDVDGLFTTVAIAVHDPSAATLTYATAGHPPPLVLGPGAGEPLTACASPALGWGMATGLRQTTVAFPAGARACFFSDGVTEARTRDGLLGRERLGVLLGSAAGEQAANELLGRVRSQAESVHDDMAACVIEAHTGVGGPEQRIEEFEIDSDALDGTQGRRFLEACGIPADELESALTRASQLAAEMSGVILRVERSGQTATVTVTGASALILATPELAEADHGPGGDAGSGPPRWAGQALPIRS